MKYATKVKFSEIGRQVPKLGASFPPKPFYVVPSHFDTIEIPDSINACLDSYDGSISYEFHVHKQLRMFVIAWVNK